MKELTRFAMPKLAIPSRRIAGGYIYDTPKAGGAKGKYRGELLDPRTGQVVKRQEGTNHVFAESLFGIGWIPTLNNVSNCIMSINDDDTAIDPTFPYLRGNTIAYGRPTTGSSGSIRGASVPANQILGQRSLDSIYWKYQYEWTGSQANGETFKNIGITTQYGVGGLQGFRQHFSYWNMDTNSGYTCDGRYKYDISTAGVITKYDLWLNTSSTIDISASVGATGVKSVAYAPLTGKYYVFLYDGTPANRRLYRFSDDTFSTLEATITTVSTFAVSTQYQSYVFGNLLWSFTPTGEWHRVDFSTDDYSTGTLSTVNNVRSIESELVGFSKAHSAPTGNYIAIISSGNTVGNYGSGGIYDLTGTIPQLVAACSSIYRNGSINISVARHPLEKTEQIIYSAYQTTQHNAAITSALISEPWSKTTENGMRWTYELEVDWE